LPQRTSSVIPLMSTYNARLVCRDFGLHAEMKQQVGSVE
jgi:hypothetical protein